MGGWELALPFSLEKRFDENVLLSGPGVFSTAAGCARGTRLPGDVMYHIFLTLLSHSFLKKLVFSKTLPLHACLK